MRLAGLYVAGDCYCPVLRKAGMRAGRQSPFLDQQPSVCSKPVSRSLHQVLAMSLVGGGGGGGGVMLPPHTYILTLALLQTLSARILQWSKARPLTSTVIFFFFSLSLSYLSVYLPFILSICVSIYLFIPLSLLC